MNPELSHNALYKNTFLRTHIYHKKYVVNFIVLDMSVISAVNS